MVHQTAHINITKVVKEELLLLIEAFWPKC